MSKGEPVTMTLENKGGGGGGMGMQGGPPLMKASFAVPKKLLKANFNFALPMPMMANFAELWASPTMKRIMSPPVLGCVLGAIIGGIPLLRDLALGPTAPLKPLTDGAYWC